MTTPAPLPDAPGPAGLACVFESLRSGRLAGRLERWRPDGTRASVSPEITLKISDARGAVFFGAPHRAWRLGSIAVADAELGAFELFLPRRKGPLILHFMDEADALSITLEGDIDGAFQCVAERRAGVEPLLDPDRLADWLTAHSLADQSRWEPPASEADDAALDARTRLRSSHQEWFDAGRESAPFDGLVTLLDYALRFGRTDFFYEKLSLALLDRDDSAAALAVTAAGTARYPEAPGLFMHRAIALERLGALRDSLRSFVTAATLSDQPDMLRVAADAAYRIAHGDFGARPPDPRRFTQAIGLCKIAERADHGGLALYRRGVMLASQRRYDAAAAALRGAYGGPQEAEARAAIADIALIQHDFSTAARALEPLADVRSDALRAALERARVHHLGESGDAWDLVTRERDDDALVAVDEDETDPREPAPEASDQDYDAVPETAPEFAFDFIRERWSALDLHHVGSVARRTETGEEQRFIRADLADLSNTASAPSDMLRRRGDGAPNPAPRDASRGGVVVLVSPKGAFPFGGAERFLLTCARVYAQQGFTPRFIGFDAPATDQSVSYPTEFVEPRTEALRHAILAQKPAFVHAVSGAIEPVCAALRGVAIPVVKGLHFWSELRRPRHLVENADFSNADRPAADASDGPATLPADPSVRLMLLSPGPLYVNSPYLRDVVARELGIAPLCAPSVEIDPAPEAPTPQDQSAERYALMLDGRASKGGFFVLDIAERLPGRLFVIVCPQAGRRALERSIVTRRLENVAVLERAAEIDELMAGAQVVLAPSFDFVETFGRIPIEAARRGRRSIVANVGNLPLLVDDPTCVLDRDPDAWAARIERFFVEPAAAPTWPAFCEPAHARGVLERLAPSALRQTATLISGSGDLLAAGAAIEALAAEVGAPVDVIAVDGFESAAATFADAVSVASVIALDPAIYAKPYDIVALPPSVALARADFFAATIIELDVTSNAPRDEQRAAIRRALAREGIGPPA